MALMRAFFTGVSGLKSHQLSIDVIANNIANANTPGFKASRATFSEILADVLQGATRGEAIRGGRNPLQVGMGVRVGDVTSDFSQSQLESTGNPMDLAINGDGFFVVSDGIDRYYTRAGTFHLDAAGKMVDVNGMRVQGKIADARGEIPEGARVQDITISFGQKIPARATTLTRLDGNLNADSDPRTQVWTANRLWVVTGTGAAATVTTALTDVENVSLQVGDEIRIAGLLPDGTTASAVYQYNTGDTVGTLLASINTAFAGSATATIDDAGRLVLTDNVPGKSQTMIRLSFAGAPGSSFAVPTFSKTGVGRDRGSHTITSTVFDSLGQTHVLTVTFRKDTTLTDTWSWQVEIDGGEIGPIAGSTGSVTFNSDGSLASFGSVDANPITFDPGGAAEVMRVNLDAGEIGMFTGLSQFASASTAVARSQDGFGMGELESISIDQDGTVRGAFTNGISQSLAQLILAHFTNPGGLMRKGDSLFAVSPSSGDPVLREPARESPSVIRSGALETSNVDLSQQLTDMIIVQRGFQANARVIRMSSTVMDELMGLIR